MRIRKARLADAAIIADFNARTVVGDRRPAAQPSARPPRRRRVAEG